MAAKFLKLFRNPFVVHLKQSQRHPETARTDVSSDIFHKVWIGSVNAYDVFTFIDISTIFFCKRLYELVKWLNIHNISPPFYILGMAVPVGKL
jgi:hypothetical protein